MLILGLLAVAGAMDHAAGAAIGLVAGTILGGLLFLFRFGLAGMRLGGILYLYAIVGMGAPCGFIGMLAGFFADAARDAGNVTASWVVIAVALALCVLRTPRKPREDQPPIAKNPDQRAAWAARRSAQLAEDDGLHFANVMHGELIESGRNKVRNPLDQWLLKRDYYRARCASVPDIERAAAGGYDDSDNGWRWEITSTSPLRVLVSPDPLLGREGPVFDMTRDWIAQRDRRGAPGRMVGRDLVDFDRFRQDFADTVNELRAAGRWNGDPSTLLPAVIDATRGHATRAQIREPKEKAGWTWVRVSWPPGQSPVMINAWYRPVSAATSTPYQLMTQYSDTRFMVDEHGGWHMGLGEVTVNDPPPPPFLLDPTIPIP